MRYLLDGYASLYPPGPHGEVLLALKKLQDCLGDIQDVDVQSAYLSSLATTLVRSGGSADVILAMGALRERARQRDAAARMRLASQLQRFCGSETRGRVQALALQPEACPA
jgi:CHAD domain-containing protein